MDRKIDRDLVELQKRVQLGGYTHPIKKQLRYITLTLHGVDDNVVPVQATEVAKARVDELVSEMGGDASNLYQVKTYRGLDHKCIDGGIE